MPKKIARPVFAGGQWWQVGDEPPEAVARLIRNPRVWSTDEDADTTSAVPKRRRDAEGPRLARPVNVGGTWYTPDDDIPDEVAARIRNPKAWVDGVMPSPAERRDAGGAGEADPGAGSGDGPTRPSSGDAPPRSGKGSGQPAWAAFLDDNKVEFDRSASREELIATAERAGLIDKE